MPKRTIFPEKYNNPGAHIVINDRTAERVEAAVAKLRGELPGAQVQGMVADLGSAEGCERMTQQLPAVDVLVNNLGIFEPKPFEQIADADWLRFFEVNVLSGVQLSRHYVAGMRATGAASSSSPASRR